MFLIFRLLPLKHVGMGLTQALYTRISCCCSSILLTCILDDTNCEEIKKILKFKINKPLTICQLQFSKIIPDSTISVLISLKNQGIFPQFLETGIVIQLYKGGKLVYPSNFRSIHFIKTFDFWKQHINSGDIVAALFDYLIEAFDYVNYALQLRKLHYYGIRYSNFVWFESYLSNINHVVWTRTKCM